MYDNIKLDKSFYNITGKSFTQVLTELDPDEGYMDTEMRGLDAFERQLKRFDIKVSGPDSDRVEKFFSTSQSAVLLPEYIRRMIKKGLDRVCIADIVCGAVSHTDGMDFRGISLTVAAGGPVQEKGNIPVMGVQLQKNSSSLCKFARELNCSYESIRKQKLEVFGMLLRAMGSRVGMEINSHICTQLTSGIATSSIEGNSLSYADLARFWGNMANHDMDVMICSPSVMANILALPEMKFCVSDYMTGGRIKTPYGVTLVKCSQMTENTIIGIDSTAAAELILGSDLIIDQDKILSTQIKQISCSVLAGVSRIDSDAVQVLKTSAK